MGSFARLAVAEWVPKEAGALAYGAGSTLGGKPGVGSKGLVITAQTLSLGQKGAWARCPECPAAILQVVQSIWRMPRPLWRSRGLETIALTRSSDLENSCSPQRAPAAPQPSLYRLSLACPSESGLM